jgi:hypothetical protein
VSQYQLPFDPKAVALMRSAGSFFVKHESRLMIFEDAMLAIPKKRWEFYTHENHPVVACREGRVFDLPSDLRNEHSLQLRHEDDTFAMYTNVESTLEQGYMVEQGEVIAQKRDGFNVGVEVHVLAGCVMHIFGKRRWAVKISFDY